MSRFWFSRKLSRTSRFRRLRRFDRRTRFFATASPRRAAPVLRARARTEKYRSDERTGSSNTRRKSRFARSRRSRPNERSRSRVRSSRSQARPALGPPCLDDPPPRAGTHLGAESAAAFRTANARLKRPFHSMNYGQRKGGEAYRCGRGGVNRKTLKAAANLFGRGESWDLGHVGCLETSGHSDVHVSRCNSAPTRATPASGTLLST